EALLADLLRSEAAVRGPGAALERFERYRRDLRERLGTSPGERLRLAHRELLALDGSVRKGVRQNATSLVGRDADLEALRALLASSRAVSIVGPGGLGKTRLAPCSRATRRSRSSTSSSSSESPRRRTSSRRSARLSGYVTRSAAGAR